MLQIFWSINCNSLARTQLILQAMPLNKKSAFSHTNSWEEFNSKLLSKFGNLEVFRREALTAGSTSPKYAWSHHPTSTQNWRFEILHWVCCKFWRTWSPLRHYNVLCPQWHHHPMPTCSHGHNIHPQTFQIQILRSSQLNASCHFLFPRQLHLQHGEGLLQLPLVVLWQFHSHQCWCQTGLCRQPNQMWLSLQCSYWYTPHKPCSLCSYKGFKEQQYPLSNRCGIKKLSSHEILKIMDATRSCPFCPLAHSSNYTWVSTRQDDASKSCSKGCIHNGHPVNYAACKHSDKTPSITVSKVGSDKSIPIPQNPIWH